MTRTKISFKGLLALLVSLSMLWVMCLSCVSLAAETGKTFKQTMEITQTILTKKRGWYGLLWFSDAEFLYLSSIPKQ